MRRVLATIAIGLDFIAPRTADRLATWLWTHAIEGALAYQRDTHPTPGHARPPVPALTPDAPAPTHLTGSRTTTKRDADTSQRNP